MYGILFDFQPSIIVCFLDSLVSWYQDFGWDGLATELLLHVLIFILLLLHDHFLDLLLSDGLRACLLSQVEVEGLRHGHTVLAFFTLGSLLIVAGSELSTSEVFFVERSSDVATLGGLGSISAAGGARIIIFKLVRTFGCADFGVTGIACALAVYAIVLIILVNVLVIKELVIFALVIFEL
jgi:hypothetical protein